MYQFQTHSHRSRLQWISSLKKAIDNSGEEVNFDKYSCLLVTTIFFPPAEREVPAEASVAEARFERGRAGAKAESH